MVQEMDLGIFPSSHRHIWECVPTRSWPAAMAVVGTIRRETGGAHDVRVSHETNPMPVLPSEVPSTDSECEWLECSFN